MDWYLGACYGIGNMLCGMLRLGLCHDAMMITVCMLYYGTDWFWLLYAVFTHRYILQEINQSAKQQSYSRQSDSFH